MTLPDPTYRRNEIEAKPNWKLAFWLSEYYNNDAPIGWARYIPIAEKTLKEAMELPQHE